MVSRRDGEARTQTRWQIRATDVLLRSGTDRVRALSARPDSVAGVREDSNSKKAISDRASNSFDSAAKFWRCAKHFVKLAFGGSNPLRPSQPVQSPPVHIRRILKAAQYRGRFGPTASLRNQAPT